MIRWMPPDKLGQSTTKVSTDFLRQNGLDVVNEWYHSPYGVDLFIWCDGNGKIIKFQLCILGLVSEWTHLSGLKTGMIVEEETANPVNKINSSDLVQFDENPLPSTLDYSLQVLTRIQGLPVRRMEFIEARMKAQEGLLKRMKSWFFKT